MANYNEMSEESFKRLMVATCLKENAENTVREYQAIERRYVEILDAYSEAEDTVDDLLDQNKIPEFQKAFRHVHETMEETHACRVYIQKLKMQMFKSAISFVRFGLASNPSSTLEDSD